MKNRPDITETPRDPPAARIELKELAENNILRLDIMMVMCDVVGKAIDHFLKQQSQTEYLTEFGNRHRNIIGKVVSELTEIKSDLEVCKSVNRPPTPQKNVSTQHTDLNRLYKTIGAVIESLNKILENLKAPTMSLEGVMEKARMEVVWRWKDEIANVCKYVKTQEDQNERKSKGDLKTLPAQIISNLLHEPLLMIDDFLTVKRESQLTFEEIVRLRRMVDVLRPLRIFVNLIRFDPATEKTMWSVRADDTNNTYVRTWSEMKARKKPSMERVRKIADKIRGNYTMRVYLKELEGAIT